MLVPNFSTISSSGTLPFNILHVAKEILKGRCLFQILAKRGKVSLLFLRSWLAEEQEKDPWGLGVQTA